MVPAAKRTAKRIAKKTRDRPPGERVLPKY